MAVKRYHVCKVFSQKEEPKIITAKSSKEALKAYVHYDIGYVPDVMHIEQSGLHERAFTNINGIYYRSVIRGFC